MMKTIAALSFILSTSAFAAGEQLKGLSIGSDGVTITVESGGCTGKNSFKIEKSIIRNRPVINFVRQGMDYCEAYFPYGASFTYSFEELGLSQGDQFKIMNDINTESRVF